MVDTVKATLIGMPDAYVDSGNPTINYNTAELRVGRWGAANTYRTLIGLVRSSILATRPSADHVCRKAVLRLIFTGGKLLTGIAGDFYPGDEIGNLGWDETTVTWNILSSGQGIIERHPYGFNTAAGNLGRGLDITFWIEQAIDNNVNPTVIVCADNEAGEFEDGSGIYAAAASKENANTAIRPIVEIWWQKLDTGETRKVLNPIKDAFDCGGATGASGTATYLEIGGGTKPVRNTALEFNTVAEIPADNIEIKHAWLWLRKIDSDAGIGTLPTQPLVERMVIAPWSEDVPSSWSGPTYGVGVAPDVPFKLEDVYWVIPIHDIPPLPDLTRPHLLMNQFWGLLRNANIYLARSMGDWWMRFGSRENALAKFKPELEIVYKPLTPETGEWRVPKFKSLSFTDSLSYTARRFGAVLGDIKPEDVAKWKSKDSVTFEWRGVALYSGFIDSTTFDSATREMTINGFDWGTGILLRRSVNLHPGAEWRTGKLALKKDYPVSDADNLPKILYNTGIALGSVEGYNFTEATEMCSAAEAIERMATYRVGAPYEWWVGLEDKKINFKARRGSDKNIIIRNLKDDLGNQIISLELTRYFGPQHNRVSLVTTTGIKLTHAVDASKIREVGRKDGIVHGITAWAGSEDGDVWKYLPDYVAPARTVRLTMPLRTDIEVGDGIKIIDDLAGLNEILRVVEKTVTIDERGEQMELQLETRAPEFAAREIFRRLFDLERP